MFQLIRKQYSGYRLYVTVFLLLFCPSWKKNSDLCCGLLWETKQSGLPQLLCLCNEWSISRLHLWSVVSGFFFFLILFQLFWGCILLAARPPSRQASQVMPWTSACQVPSFLYPNDPAAHRLANTSLGRCQCLWQVKVEESATRWWGLPQSPNIQDSYFSILGQETNAVLWVCGVCKPNKLFSSTERC